jgi:hypothetical protein
MVRGANLERWEERIMSPQEFQSNGNGSPTLLGGKFTAEEAARLRDLRDNFHEHAEYLERVLDERRLGFVRWLIETGRISESV